MKQDQELIERLRLGDQEAFGLLVKNLLPSAYKTAYLILRSKEHAEDALQIALEGAFVSIMRGKDITNFKSWFYSLVYSRSIDIYRKNNRHLHNDFDNNSEAQMKVKSQSAQQTVILKEDKTEMMVHITKLKREESLPIYLHYYEDMAVKEIALILDENINTVKTRMKRGKVKLAQLIKESNHFFQEVKANGI
ncbi:MAG: RNA polymerase sigma factor [Neobacillus sp.]